MYGFNYDKNVRSVRQYKSCIYVACSYRYIFRPAILKRNIDLGIILYR